MKIARSTKQRIEAIQTEAAEPQATLELLHARLEEHSGTKRICRKLKRVIEELDEWRNEPFVQSRSAMSSGDSA